MDALVQAERFLTDTAYIAGDTFTLADIAAYTSAFAMRQALDWSALPLLHAWYTKIGARPGGAHAPSHIAAPWARLAR
ncbi:glutathione binding-like protein [Burkholderia pyrrocinia]|uniref:glutathione binding-like protein n=1 Tax=Burkholderia pyrrocinia TaxID=60550 RepID=UPI00223933EB|nr:glutathione binding-like protein [Burkholderia pyrrocinia]